MAGLSLPEQMQRMPQEIWDVIHDLVFAPPLSNPASRSVRIDRDYKPPALLQVERAFRDAHQDAYYSTTTFVIADPTLGRRWARTLTDEQFAKVNRIRCAFGPERTLRSSIISRIRALVPLFELREYACVGGVERYSGDLEMEFRRGRRSGGRRRRRRGWRWESMLWGIDADLEGVVFIRRR